MSLRHNEPNRHRHEAIEAYVWLKTWFRIKRKVINPSSDPLNMLHMDHCRQRIQDAADDIEDNRILEEEDAMAWEAGEINDGYLIENENVADEIEGNNYAFQIILNTTAHGGA